MNDKRTIGARSKPYTTMYGDKPVIVVDEYHYDVSYDTYFKLQMPVNFSPTPAELFKVRLANPNE